MVIGNYCIVNQIGRGGMGAVYLVEHTRLGRQFALKRIHPRLAKDPSVVRRFFDEARQISQLENEHIVQVTDFIEEPGHTCFVMELIRGPQLSDRMRAGPIPFTEAVAITRQLCDSTLR